MLGMPQALVHVVTVKYFADQTKPQKFLCMAKIFLKWKVSRSMATPLVLGIRRSCPCQLCTKLGAQVIPVVLLGNHVYSRKLLTLYRENWAKIYLWLLASCWRKWKGWLLNRTQDTWVLTAHTKWLSGVAQWDLSWVWFLPALVFSTFFYFCMIISKFLHLYCEARSPNNGTKSRRWGLFHKTKVQL